VTTSRKKTVSNCFRYRTTHGLDEVAPGALVGREAPEAIAVALLEDRLELEEARPLLEVGVLAPQLALAERNDPRGA
jgi:hypothetical protein